MFFGLLSWHFSISYAPIHAYSLLPLFVLVISFTDLPSKSRNKDWNCPKQLCRTFSSYVMSSLVPMVLWPYAHLASDPYHTPINASLLLFFISLLFDQSNLTHSKSLRYKTNNIENLQNPIYFCCR